MKRNLFIFILLSLVTAVAAVAQTGEWVKYPVFDRSVSHISETPSKVYYVSGGFLYSYDKSSDETIAYTSLNYLTDNDVSMIEYNPDGKYLFIAYSNGAIDLLYDDGRVVAMPDIKEATVDGSKTITDVAFNDGCIYVATYFGLVIFDDKRHEVKDSGIYSRTGVEADRVASVNIIRDHVYINQGNKYMRIPKGKSIQSINNFTVMGDMLIYSTELLGEDVLVSRHPHGGLWLWKIYDNEDGSYSYTERFHSGFILSDNFMHTPDGLYFTAEGVLYLLTPDTELHRLRELGPDFANQTYGTNSGLKSMWAGNADGIACYDMSGDGGVTVLHDKYIPVGSSSVSRPAFFTTNREGNRIYVCNIGASLTNPATLTGEGFLVWQMTDLIEDGDMRNVAADKVTAVTPQGKEIIPLAGPFVVSPQRLVEDPDDPDTYYIASSFEGVYKIKDGKEVGRYQGDQIEGGAGNAPFDAPWGWRTYGVTIDRGGNLWTVSATIDPENYPGIVILPAAKRKLSPDKVKMSDWVKVNIEGYSPNKLGLFYVCKKSHMIFYSGSEWGGGLKVFDTKGTYDNFRDDVVYTWTKFTDQDGKTFAPDYVTSFCEDDNGHLWVGTNQGIIEITDPSKATDRNMTVNRIKVPRNDGTNLADYLLASEIIHGMSVDNSNRKWIATGGSGLYLVSPSGDEILSVFTPDNSPLPTTTVNDVYADRFSNAVYVATNDGLYRYNSTSSPSQPSFDNVVAYPNPVRPEYTGWITITGLMDNSLVKIADASGHVVFQGMSEGGQCMWDGCNTSGARVKTGVYYVFASRSDGSSSSDAAVATKILVVN